MQKIKFFNVKWILKNKNLRQSHHLKPLKIKKTYILRKFQCIALINYSFDDVLFLFSLFSHYFDIFFIHIFHFFYVTNVVLSFQKSITSPQSF
jgi:hypothetical protein